MPADDANDPGQVRRYFMGAIRAIRARIGNEFGIFTSEVLGQMVRQVKVVGILMIVHGALALLMGLVFLAMGPVMMTILRMEDRRSADDEIGMTVASIYYMIVGALVLVTGFLNVMSGIRCLKFRGRPMALVALFANITTVLTCYCLPTGLTAMIYGLIVLFNAEVVSAFKMAERGMSPDEIRGSFL